jgi:hypothetical protein
MASKRGRMIDPAKIPDAETWVKYYTAKFANLVLRKSDGAYLIYDPTKLADDFEGTLKSEPAKVIKVRKGYDAFVLANNGVSKELRDKAGEKIQTVITTYKGAFEQESKEYKTVEKELFEKVNEYRSTEDKIAKAKLAKTIASIQQNLAEIDEKRYNSLYPIRTTLDKTFPYKYVEYESKSDTNVSLNIMSNNSTKPLDRVIEITT